MTFTTWQRSGSSFVLRGCLAASVLLAQPPAVAAEAQVEKRISASEARQGAASDGRHVFAIDNSRIGKYRISDGLRVAGWEGDHASFPHMNSCTLAKRELVCATSNYPATPHTSRVEFFDPRRLRHLRSRDMGQTNGSLTALDWHGGHWWATFAHYDGNGGVPGKDSSQSRLAKLDRNFRTIDEWTFPPEVIARMRPYSASGGSWTAAGLLAISGHDRPEIYLLSLPGEGRVLRLEAIVPVTTQGQAIDRDPQRPGRIWSISRGKHELVLTDISAFLPCRANQAARRCSSKASTTP